MEKITSDWGHLAGKCKEIWISALPLPLIYRYLNTVARINSLHVYKYKYLPHFKMLIISYTSQSHECHGAACQAPKAVNCLSEWVGILPHFIPDEEERLLGDSGGHKEILPFPEGEITGYLGTMGMDHSYLCSLKITLKLRRFTPPDNAGGCPVHGTVFHWACAKSCIKEAAPKGGRIFHLLVVSTTCVS